MDAFSFNPFASYIHRFAIDISKADYIIIVGVSLNDYHLNSFLVNAIGFTSGKIIFVTKSTPKELEPLINGFVNFVNNGKNVFINLLAMTRDTISDKKINIRIKKLMNIWKN